MVNAESKLVQKKAVKTGFANSRSKCQRLQSEPEVSPENLDQSELEVSSAKSRSPRLEFRTDYLTLVGRLPARDQLTQMAEFVAGSFDDLFEWRPNKGMTCGRYYANTAVSARGLLLAWGETSEGFGKNKSDAKHIEFRLSIPAQPLRVVDELSAWKVFKELRFRWGCKSTRFDIACDDFSKSLLIYSEVYDAGSSGNYTGFQQFQPCATFQKGKLEGWSLYFGSSQSDKRLVLYNKAVESGGKIDSHRLELRLKQKRAETAFDAYCKLEKTLAVGDSVRWVDCPVHLNDFNPFKIQKFEGKNMVVLDWVEKPVSLASLQPLETVQDSFAVIAIPFLSSLLIAGYDFLSRSENQRVSRSERLGWWQNFLNCLQLIDVSSLAPRRPVTVIQNSLDWFQRQIAPTAALVREVFGLNGYRDWWESLLAEGKDRWGERHKTVLAVAQAEWSAT